MPKGTLVDAGVRIGFGYKDARRSGISGFGEPSKRQKLAEEEAKAKA
jgi:hypothetical protein